MTVTEEQTKLRAKILRLTRSSTQTDVLISVLADTGGIRKRARWQDLTTRELEAVLGLAVHQADKKRAAGKAGKGA